MSEDTKTGTATLSEQPKEPEPLGQLVEVTAKLLDENREELRKVRRHPHPWEHWMELCLEELRRCRYMIRLPGESYGADVESIYADTIAVPVFKSVEALVKHVGSVGSHHEREWFLNFIRETRKSLEQQREAQR